MLFGICFSNWFPAIDFSAGKLSEKKRSDKKRRQSPGQSQSVQFADINDQWYREMDKKEPPERQLSEHSSQIPERYVDKKSGNTSVKNRPGQRCTDIHFLNFLSAKINKFNQLPTLNDLGYF